MMMRLFAVLWAAALIAFATKASAHRLDEYLQATTIAVDRGQVSLQLTLTPGVSVAQAVLARIDSNGDGALSPAEQRRYAERARVNLRLVIDGALVTPELRSWTFATPAALRGGVGDISLVLTAPIRIATGERLPGQLQRILIAKDVSARKPRAPRLNRRRAARRASAGSRR